MNVKRNDGLKYQTDIRITRRKRHAGGWKVWVKYPWQEKGKIHSVTLLENGKHYCETCDQFCIGYIAVAALRSGRSTLTEETES